MPCTDISKVCRPSMKSKIKCNSYKTLTSWQPCHAVHVNHLFRIWPFFHHLEPDFVKLSRFLMQHENKIKYQRNFLGWNCIMFLLLFSFENIVYLKKDNFFITDIPKKTYIPGSKPIRILASTVLHINIRFSEPCVTVIAFLAVEFKQNLKCSLRYSPTSRCIF
jgi:hypothetical protein